MSFLPIAALPVDQSPPCAGLWAIFDSTAPEDHRAARELCAGCPVRMECEDIRVESVKRSSPGSGPVGTWAGRLYGLKGPREVPAREVSSKVPEKPAAANAARREATHCKRGHPFDEDNTYVSPNGRRTCRVCVRVSKAEWASKSAPVKGSGKAAHCKRGHAFTNENTIHGTDGRRRCRQCKRNSANARAQRK